MTPVTSADTWVVVPAYNEEKVIAQVLGELVSRSYQVVLVNDGSSDRTAQTALLFPVTVLSHVTNLGQGAALQTGIRYALRFLETRYIVTFDADGQHRAEDVGKLLEICRQGGYEVVLGSRFLQEGRAENIGFTKYLTLRLAILFTRVATRLPITDTHNGLRVFTAQAAARLRITHNGMAHASEILMQIASFKLRYCEAPVTISYNLYSKQKGQSIWNGINILWDMWFGRLR